MGGISWHTSLYVISPVDPCHTIVSPIFKQKHQLRNDHLRAKRIELLNYSPFIAASFDYAEPTLLRSLVGSSCNQFSVLRGVSIQLKFVELVIS
jgi:hypothetical protein